MKRLLLLAAMLVFAFCNIVNAADFTPTKKVVLFYRVSDTILQAQNEAEDIAKGQAELEKELRHHYGKRFLIQDIKRNTLPAGGPAAYRKLINPNQEPFMVSIELIGEDVTADHYHNAYGAQATGYAPAIKVQLVEGMPNSKGDKFSAYDYGVQTYSAGTFTVGMGVYAAETDPRKNVKNAVRAVFRDACKLNEQINKYVNPKGAEMELARYNGDFEKLVTAKKKDEALDTAELDKFIEWCKADPNRLSLLTNLDLLPTLKQKLDYIERLKQFGYYK